MPLLLCLYYKSVCLFVPSLVCTLYFLLPRNFFYIFLHSFHIKALFWPFFSFCKYFLPFSPAYTHKQPLSVNAWAWTGGIWRAHRRDHSVAWWWWNSWCRLVLAQFRPESLPNVSRAGRAVGGLLRLHRGSSISTYVVLAQKCLLTCVLPLFLSASLPFSSSVLLILAHSLTLTDSHSLFHMKACPFWPKLFVMYLAVLVVTGWFELVALFTHVYSHMHSVMLVPSILLFSLHCISLHTHICMPVTAYCTRLPLCALVQWPLRTGSVVAVPAWLCMSCACVCDMSCMLHACCSLFSCTLCPFSCGLRWLDGDRDRDETGQFGLAGFLSHCMPGFCYWHAPAHLSLQWREW